MRDLSAIVKDVAKDAVKIGEDAGNAIRKHYADIADGLKKSARRYLDEDAAAASKFENLLKKDAKGAEQDASQAARDATRDAGQDGNPIASALSGDDRAAANAGPPKGGDLDRAGESPGASRDPESVCPGGDPVDVATGEVIMAADDVTLPGVLPLVLRRTHRSSWQTGRYLGRSWLSTFDQRLRVTGKRVRGAFDDGRILTWTLPDDSTGPVVASHGSAWVMRYDDSGSYEVTDQRNQLTWRFEPRPGFYAGPFSQVELPLVQIRDRVGHSIDFAYAETGDPVSVTHSSGYRIDATTADGLITALTLAGTDVPLISYEYDDSRNLARIVNSSGQPLRLSYDEAGRLTGWEDRNGQYYRYEYDDAGRCASGEGPGGMLSGTFDYEPGITRWTDAAGSVTTYEISDEAYVSAVTDPLGNTIRWDHDDRGKLIGQTDPLGRVTRYAYDERGNLTVLTRPDGSQAIAEYDERSQLVSLTEPDGATWRYAYDERGNRTALTGPDGGVTSFGYDGQGHLTRVTGPGGMTTSVRCGAAGLPVEVTEPGGARTRYETDAAGNINLIIGPDGAATAVRWTAEGKPASQTHPDGTSESWDWDGEGNLVRYVSPGGAVTSYEYGPFDKVTAVVSPDGVRTEFRYDHDLRVAEVMHAGLAWRYEYDAAGRLTSEVDYNGAATTYEYDAAGQLIRKINAAGQEISLKYDVLGNLTERMADGAITEFGHDAAGNVTWARGPDTELRFERDVLGRITAETCDGRTVATAYGTAGQITRRVTPSGAVTDWEFDPAGRPSAMTAGGHQLRFRYDEAGRETIRDLPGGLVLAQEWDRRGRLAAQAVTGQGRSSWPTFEGQSQRTPADASQLLQQRAYTYSSDGFVTAITDMLVGDRAFGLDQAGRITRVTGPGWSEQYSYNPAGTVIAGTWSSLPSESPHSWFGAEAQGTREVSGTRITRAGNIRYRFDAAGRVTARTRTRISRKPETWHYQWDADNRLTAVTIPDGSTWQYRYDPVGRRVAKQHVSADGKTLSRISFTWDGAVLAEQAEEFAAGDTVGEHVTTWEYQPGTLALLAQSAGTIPRDAPQDQIDRRFRSIITDLTGAPVELVAPDGSLVDYQQRTVWGGTAWHSGEEASPLRFPGQYDDPETGLYYNNQRYYDPVTASYLSPDPLGLSAGPNPHSYVGNPQVETDSIGLIEDCKGRKLTYVTYTKTNPKTGEVYSGRARGYGTPQEVVANRDSDHHMTDKGFGPAQLDQHTTATKPIESRHSDPAYQAIRGREQHLIDANGKAQSEGGTSGNAIRGIAPDNPLRDTYMKAAEDTFGIP